MDKGVSMRFSIILIAVMLMLVACEHKGVNEFTQTENMVVANNATYAAMVPEKSNATIKPSSECAQGYDGVITHLENLMAKKNAQRMPDGTP